MSENEFTRSIRVEPLPRAGLEHAIEATAPERAELAALNGLVAIERLSAQFRIAKWRRGVKVEGEMKARVTQTCVVSLEPFEVDVESPIDVKFLPADARAPEPAPGEDEDAPDVLIDGRIDLGAIASEFLTLSLDPYPRKPGVAFASPEAPDEPGSAFQDLVDLAKRGEPD